MNHVLVASLAFALPLAAQTVAVFPRDHRTVEGYSSISNWPFSAGIGRAQFLYSNWRFDVPNAAVIRRVGIRPDFSGTGGGRRVQLEVWMGHSDPAIANTTTFDNNYIGQAAHVFDRRIVDLPTVAAVTQGPHTTMVWLALDRTFTYDASKELVVEYRLFANDNGNAAFTYRADRANYLSVTSTFGTPCPTSNNRLPAITTDEIYVGGAWTVSLANAPATSAGVLVIGLSNTTWNGVPLPLPLDSLGATGCSLAVSIDANAPIVTNTAGGFSAYLPVPNVRSLYSTVLHAQAAIGDLFANNAGFVTSRSGSSSIGIQPQAQLLSAVGDAAAATGSLSNNYGLVAVFEY